MKAKDLILNKHALLYVCANLNFLMKIPLPKHKMQKLNKLILLLAFLGFPLGMLHAQVTILDQTLLTQQSFNTFTPVSVTGLQSWSFSSSYGAMCSGYANSQSNANEDWFISPVMNLSQMGNVNLTFSHTRGPGGVLNVGVAEGWYKVFATANYTGNPSTTQWAEVNGLNQNVTTAWNYISSGSLTIPESAKSQTSRIAFRYMSSATESATWEIKNVKVTGSPDSASVFTVTNWNIEWLGCTQFGPDDEGLQISNAAQAMLLMDSDIYCIQEIINTPSHPSIETLVNLMGSDQWGGAIAPVNTGECNQRQGIIYKKSKVQLVNSSVLSNGNGSQGNSYSFNWSSGRFPSLYNVNLLAGSQTIPVSIVNIHAKAEDGDASSYTRRLGGSIGLKTILDGASYNTKNVMVIGDFNDYLIGTTSEACNCTASPFKNFMDDQSNYTGITQNLEGSWGNPVIENIIVSNELVDNYFSGSAMREVNLPEEIFDYYDTTSNHLPVTATFQFTPLSNPEFSKNSWTIYPNPVKGELHINSLDAMDNISTEIYDLTGRLVFSEKLNEDTINVSALPSGIYILRIDNKSAKFVKE